MRYTTPLLRTLNSFAQGTCVDGSGATGVSGAGPDPGCGTGGGAASEYCADGPTNNANSSEYTCLNGSGIITSPPYCVSGENTVGAPYPCTAGGTID